MYSAAQKHRRLGPPAHDLGDSPGAVEVTLSHAAVLRQRRWIEPEGWQALPVAVSLIAIVTGEDRLKKKIQ